MSDLDLRNVRAIVTDADVLGRLDPVAVGFYLSRHGWTQHDQRRTGAIWARELEGGLAAAVLLPNDQTYADYAIRMGALLATLALTENRSQLAVLVDLYGGQATAGDDPTNEARQ